METERNQRFVSLDRAIEQNQRLNHVCRVCVSPSSTARPHTVARHATHRKLSIRQLSRLLVDGSRHGVLVLLEEIDELGRTASCSTDSQELFTCMLWPAIATFERGAVACTGKRRGRRSLGRRAASMPAPVRGRVCCGRA